MIKIVDPRLSSEVVFLLWAMGHGDEVAVVDSRYVVDRDGDVEVRGTVVQMSDVDVPETMRAILSVVQLDTTFVADPVRQIEHPGSEPLCEVRRAVQEEVDDALGFSCSITGVADPEFHEQVKNCYGLIITGDPRKQGAFILRKGLDVTPDSALAAGDGGGDVLEAAEDAVAWRGAKPPARPALRPSAASSPDGNR